MRGRVAIAYACLLLATATLALANLCMGSVPVALDELWGILLGSDAAGTSAQVIWGIRLPRLVAAGLLGGALALSGMLLQAFFGNPLAGPYILGISSGAKLAVATVMIVVVGAAGVMASWMAVAAALAGSLAVMGLMLLASRRIRSSSALIVAGVMMGYICSALTDFLVTFADDASIVSLRNWSMGSFSGTNWDDVGTMAAFVACASACVFALSKQLGAYLLGEDYARSVGVNVRAFRIAIIVLSSLLAACVTAFAGPISFVGIAVPHVAKRLMGTSKPLLVIPASFLGGAAFCLLCDLIARTAFAPTEMSVSTVTAALGAPVVVRVMRGRSRAARRSGGTQARPPRTDDAHAPVPGPVALRRPETVAPLRTRGLCVGYDGLGVVEDIDVEVLPGRMVTLIGPNGAGKSTMLRTMAGLQEALDGTVWLCGADLAGLAARERSRSCAVLLTGSPHTELLTCEDVVEAGRFPYTGRLGVLSDEDHACVREAMEAMRVWDLRQSDYMQISDGQRQRVLLARALCQQPRLLVLDEPTSFLDIRHQVELFEALRVLADERGIGILMSLHELSIARQVSDWVVCVRDHRVLAQGTPADIYDPSVINRLFDLEDGMYDARTSEVRVRAGERGGA